MHAIALHTCQFGRHLDFLTRMYRLRRRVFKDRLDWSVSLSGDLEIDIYDALSPTYLLVLSNENEVLGCVRLLPTTGPTMLADTFANLLGAQAAPRDERILESSRFCVDTERSVESGRHGFNRATFVLFAAMIEAMRSSGARSIVTVTDARMERILRRAGWPLERLSDPQPLGRTMALAGFLHDSDQALEAMYRQARVDGPVLVGAGSHRMAA
ncbi:GNAT family N-acetyltransferase [Bradyrhizobium sp. AUGA SZCCT0240]|uniref:acyl-homoserine-lactone synthase n=1 Tax=unclassified Bradyrhizobium TaxID=2631580 RepID=UPI001BAB8D66|nr:MULTISPECIES: acyl-homoserine-lactone synthase [unclassified Bradyrhizobium]MBR1194193.1 GNAT family N-acetyltransferase [Bradyrhizobium sp. AUGA SZCCT0160]MBR1243491.1 GNAT family N-acetyltransferase [Bradyrhizobium sp. AUGA SZCCT0274]MBR1258386.1 GNAT family N-acetyltransferase [Bradyrhizobium sp. AUGA SZCCT0240]